MPAPTRPTSLLNRSEGVDTLTPEGRAAVLLTHPLRVWAIERAITHGHVSAHDLRREFPAVTYYRLGCHLEQLTTAGWLIADDQYRRGKTGARLHFLGDISPLYALHTYLSNILPTPEAKK